jgi:hypothetical protein
MIFKHFKSQRRRRLGFALAWPLLIAGCVHYGQFRDDRPNDPKGAHKSIWLPEKETKYYLGFIEVDDFGELFSRTQLEHVVNLIQQAKKNSPSKNAIVVTFIHGWKNNASDDSGNVWGFREELKDISLQYPTHSVVGIYIGWRGAVSNLPVIKEFTFYDRRNAAIRIPGAHLTEVLETIMHETKSCLGAEHCSEESAPGTGSLSIIVGHSFGGMVLERSLTQSVVGNILRQEADRKEEMRKWIDRKQKGLASAESVPPGNAIRPPADLIAMVNEAAPATEAKQMLDLLKKHKMKLTVKTSDNQEREEPLFLSITSEGDAATGLLMPLGQYPSLITKKMRKYQNPDPPEIKNQSTYYLHTSAHLPLLFSHLIGPENDKNIAKAKELAQPANARCFPSEELHQRYCIVPVPDRYNDTPYWVMQMPKEFVPDHSTIFRPVFRELLAQFIVPRMTPEGVKPATIQLPPGQEQ